MFIGVQRKAFVTPKDFMFLIEEMDLQSLIKPTTIVVDEIIAIRKKK